MERSGMNDAAAPAPAAPAAQLPDTPSVGLSSTEVANRRARAGERGGEQTSRSVTEILRANILTRFNFILGVLLAVILAVGSRKTRCSASCSSSTR
jgi:cation-transporting ATPase E